MVKDIQALRRVNTLTVLDIVRNHGPIARTKLARMTGLTQATAFAIVEDLVDKNLLAEIGLGSSEGGRRPRLYAINPDAPTALGVEVRGSKVLALLMDLTGEIRGYQATPLTSSREDDVVLAVKTSVAGILAGTGGGPRNVIGIGIAMPGVLDTEAGVAISCPYFDWSNLPIAGIAAREFGFPTIVEYNVRAQAIGERWFGAGKEDVSELVCVNVGFGISAGLIVNKVVYRGWDGLAGLLGHVCVDEDGPRCGCGNFGCLEAVASEAAIIRRATKAIRQGADSLIMSREALANGDQILLFSLIPKAAREGDPLAISLLEEAAQYLGVGLAIIVNLLSPELVVIGGEITEVWDIISPTIERTMAPRTYGPRPGKVRIVPSALKVNASSIGAAALVFKKTGLLPDAENILQQYPPGTVRFPLGERRRQSW